jgi:hypothetical protein
MLSMLSRFKRRSPDPELPRFPDRGEAAAWMRSKVLQTRQRSTHDAQRLFDPTSGDYLPTSVHTGSYFDEEALASYRTLKAEFPDLVAASLNEPMAFCVSRIADPEDLQAHAHRIGV